MAGEQRRSTDRGLRRLVRENWYRDAWLLAITAVVLFSAIEGYTANRDRINDIQTSRAANTLANTLARCEETNRQNAGIVAFVIATIPPARRMDVRMKRFLGLAERSFPQQNCAALVKRSVQKNP